MKNIIKLGFTLALFAVVSCALLAVVNNFTSPRIEAYKKAKTEQGLKIVFPDSDKFMARESNSYAKKIGTTEIIEMYDAFKSEEKIGTIAKVSGPTYDKSTILVGINLDKKITGVVFLENTDSPGFGQKASDSSFKTSAGKTFYGQFENLSIENPLVMGKDFEAISGATITSRGVETLVNDAVSAMLK